MAMSAAAGFQQALARHCRHSSGASQSLPKKGIVPNRALGAFLSWTVQSRRAPTRSHKSVAAHGLSAPKSRLNAVFKWSPPKVTLQTVNVRIDPRHNSQTENALRPNWSARRRAKYYPGLNQ